MDIRIELLSNYICDVILNWLGEIDIDVSQIPQTTAISALSEIKDIIKNDKMDDFDKVDEIVEIFIKYNIDSGNCHDFG